MALNIADLIEHCVDLVPDRIAIESGDRACTYAEMDERANRLAHHLIAEGVRPGDRVGLYSRNTIECIVAMIAIFKARAVMVNVNYRYVEKELTHILDDSDAVALIYERQYSDKVAAILPGLPLIAATVVIEDGTDTPYGTHGAVRYDDALAAQPGGRSFGERSGDDLYFLYTGGTTGMPKGVMWRQEDVWRVLGGGINFVTGEYVADEWQLAQEGAGNPQMVRYPIPPFIHGGSQWAVFQSLFTAGKAVVYPEFDGDVAWRIIEKHGVNVLFIVGDAMARPMIDGLLSGDYDTSTLYAIASSAALFSPSVKRQYLDALPNTVLTDSIGSSETGFSGMGLITKDTELDAGPRVKIDDSTQVLGEDGDPVEPGSGQVGLLARCGILPIGYHKDEAKSAKTFRTIKGVRYSIPGDYATVDADGTVTMLGRGSVSINTGGEKVFPEEVEGAVKSHPGVFDALVVGIPDDRMGSAVAAVVAVRDDAVPSFESVDSAVREHIAGYKTPRALWFVDEIKRSPAGKPDYKWARSVTESRPADARKAAAASNS
ncbi:acyl-CoA synthetase [Tomitella fengzijianii]|uniref:Acyl-CoA synthetase n=1 Tax=Tomitella fengzijianii TaxID=2597660 RepID=A0A516X163_9ACTN|nr:acyl-CoA synthetase [Tomitella fengzijianii]QDQ96822.1 acyl-CoA synthetase [Tomitella fengzijianii]